MPDLPALTLLSSDDADLLAEGATLLEEARQRASIRAARDAREEDYKRSYQALRDEILLMQGASNNAQFHGQTYDLAAHLPRLTALLVSYFHVLQQPEPLGRLSALDEGALLQYYRKNGNPGLARICLKYTVRLFQTGATGLSQGHIERKLAEVIANEALAGVWGWMVTLGFALGPEQSPSCVANGEGKAPRRPDDGPPAWDQVHRVLTYGGQQLREYRDSAEAQIAILDTFQELAWADVVDSPFSGDKKGKGRLKNAIKNLNRGLQPKGVLEFLGDGSGTRVRWRRL
jgi:hypothetical protein